MPGVLSTEVPAAPFQPRSSISRPARSQRATPAGESRSRIRNSSPPAAAALPCIRRMCRRWFRERAAKNAGQSPLNSAWSTANRGRTSGRIERRSSAADSWRQAGSSVAAPSNRMSGKPSSSSPATNRSHTAATSLHGSSNSSPAGVQALPGKRPTAQAPRPARYSGKAATMRPGWRTTSVARRWCGANRSIHCATSAARLVGSAVSLRRQRSSQAPLLAAQLGRRFKALAQNQSHGRLSRCSRFPVSMAFLLGSRVKERWSRGTIRARRCRDSGIGQFDRHNPPSRSRSAP